MGSSTNVDIKNDPWLLCTADLYIHTSNEAIIDRKVDSLMVTGSNMWDFDLPQNNFVERDINLIFSVPI